MIDLKTIKEITIAEGSVTKITNSSGVVLWQKVVAPSSSLDVDLNNQWVASTKTLDGYKVYMSNSNHNVNNGYASMKFKFNGMPDFKLWINSYAESNYDYTVAWNLDVNYPTSNPSSSSSGVKAYTTGKQYNPTNITAFTEVDYPNDGGEHFVVVTYRKDSSYDSNDDRGYVAVRLAPTSTTWVVSETEFVKKDDKYYEKLTEVGTYEDGSTALTGNYKEGNELTVTYKQGTADDFFVVKDKKYYKIYKYVTLNGKEVNTGDYFQGDYIDNFRGMYVRYVDGTTKTFSDLTAIKYDTDANKKNAKEVFINPIIKTIDIQAFWGCSNLTSVTISDYVTSIGVKAFNGCTHLTGVTIPNTVTAIDDGAFSGCNNLETATLPIGLKRVPYNCFDSCYKLTGVTIPTSVTLLDNSAFARCEKLTGITIPNSVTSIGQSAFENCSSLSSVTIQNSTSKISYNSNAFTGIASNAKLYVPSNLLSNYQSDSSWTGAFGGGIFAIDEQVITNAMKITMNDGTEKTINNLSTISRNTVSNSGSELRQVKDVVIYNGVTSIGGSAFYYGESITSVTIPNSVTEIGNSAFDSCFNIKDLTLPNSLKIVGNYAFEIGYKLKTITVKATTPPFSTNFYIFDDCEDCETNPTIYVPAESVDAYKMAYGWKQHKNNIKAIGT